MNFNPASATFRAHPSGRARRSATRSPRYNAAEPDGGSNEAGHRRLGRRRAAARRVAHPRRDRALGRALLQVRLPRLARLRGRTSDLYELHDAFVAMLDRAARRLPGRHLPDRRDQRLPAVPVRVGRARADVVPERRARAVDRCCTTCGSCSPYIPAFALGQKVLGGRRVQALAGRHADGGRAAVADLVLRRPAHAADGGASTPARAVAGRGARRTATSSAASLPAARRSAHAGVDRAAGLGPGAGRGALLAFRQDVGGGDATVALRERPARAALRLRSAPDGAVVGTVTSEQLRAGVPVTVRSAARARRCCSSAPRRRGGGNDLVAGEAEGLVAALDEVARHRARNLGVVVGVRCVRPSISTMQLEARGNGSRGSQGRRGG